MSKQEWYTKRANLDGLAVKAIKGDGTTAYGVLDQYGALRKGDGIPVRCLKKGSYEWGIDGMGDFVSVELMVDPKDWEFVSYEQLTTQLTSLELRAKINNHYYLVRSWDRIKGMITLVVPESDGIPGAYKVPMQLVSGFYTRWIIDGIYRDSQDGLWLVQKQDATPIAPEDKSITDITYRYMQLSEELGPMQLVTRLGGNSNGK